MFLMLSRRLLRGLFDSGDLLLDFPNPQLFVYKVSLNSTLFCLLLTTKVGSGWWFGVAS